MALNLKKALLAGTAIVAVASFSSQAHALDRVLTANGTWASGGTCDTALATIATACANDAVDITTGAVTLTITSGGPNDGSGTNTFNLGAITDSGAGVGSVSITGNTTAGVQTVNIASANIDGNFTLAHADGQATTNQVVAIAGGLTVGGALSLTSLEATAAETQAVTVGGAVAVTGTTTLTAGALVAGGTTGALTITGNSTFTGAVTVTGGAGHATANTYTLTLNGATNAFDGGLTLADGGAGSDAILTLSGSVAQTVSGTISGGAVGKINVANASGATFSGTVAAALITIENGGGALNSSATFKNTVTSAVTLGGAGTGTNTVTFDGTTQGFTVTGAVNATVDETNNIVVTNSSGAAKTVVQASAWGAGGEVDNLTISGTGTTLDSNAAITVKAVTGVTTIGSGATLDVGAGLLTSPTVTVGGTLLLSGTGGVTGVVNGSSAGVGTLSVTDSATVTGNIGTTSLAAINIATTKTLTATADVKATTTTLTGTGTLALGALAHNVTTNIVAAVNGDGAITIADGATTTTVVGNIGTSASKIATLAVAGGAANVLTTTGNVYVNAVTMNDADTLQFLGTSAQTVSGTIADGIITVGNGTTTSDVTFSSALSSIATGTVSAKAAATFNDATAIAAFTNAGTATIAAGKTLATTSVADGSVGTYNIGVTRAAGGAMSIAKITESGDDADYSDDTINFVVSSTAAPLTAGTLASVFTGNAGSNVTGLTVTDNSYLYKFVPTVNGNNIDVVVSIGNSIASFSENSGNTSVGNALLVGLVDSTNADINAIQGRLAAASTAAAANEVLESAQPTVDGSSIMSMTNVGASIQNINDIRLASARTDSDVTGMAAGSAANGVSMWFQGFAQHSSQDRRGGVDGYDADSFGGAVGFDSVNLWENGLVGLSFGYGNTDADSENANTTQTDVDSYGLNLYAGTQIGNGMFLNGQLGYALNNIDTVRHDSTGPGSGTNATGDTDAGQYSAKVQVGKDFATDGGMTLTPTLGASYVRLNVDGYTESGSGALTVQDQDYDMFNVGLGLDASWNLRNADGSSVKPMIRLGYTYDVTNDNIETTSAFAAAPATTFNSAGPDPARSTFNAGAGVTYATVADWDLSANYDYTFKSDFDAHAGTVRATSRF